MRKPFLILILLAGASACAHTEKSAAPAPPPSADLSVPPEVALAEMDQKLISAGVSPRSIELIHKNYVAGKKGWLESSLKIMEQNVFGFLYHGDYMSHNSPDARKKIKRYLRGHQNSFKNAELKYHVEAKSIAALLWVETKLGKNMGKHPLPWVYYSLALTSHPRFCAELLGALPQKLDQSQLTDKPDAAAARAKVQDRCKSKSEWAIEELKTLFELEKTHGLKPFKIKASFAGAFGIPQFIPSSYKKYSVSSFRKRPDLFLISDAVLSVGKFLHENGWKKGEPESYPSALYSYNRSKDYGVVITRIASEL
ncbi:MAG: hypothetical protein EBX52_02615, partial [Proteobacteria bacterium]|nr:hypothetical protein [Pseudomonadota bacterium]